MNKCLLIVDDEKLVRWSIQQSMLKEEFSVTSAADGQEALDKLAQEHFDVIITDFVMPGLNGIEMARRAKELRPEAKIIMMTAFGSALDKAEAAKAGITSFIDKPFMISEVKSVVSRLLSE
jgi:DNA-binding NtrC family response regulator